MHSVNVISKRLLILFVEDDATDLELVLYHLAHAGFEFEPIIASDRQEFIMALQSHAFDIILSDHKLPQFSSLEALEILQEHHLQTPFILVTGTVSEEFAVTILQAGADDYILKSNLSRLPSAINKAIEKKRVRSEKAVAEEDLRASYKQIRKLAAHLQMVREEERITMAREIHDVLGQMLTALRIDISAIKTGVAGTDEVLTAHLISAVTQTDEIIKTVRKIATELRPLLLDDMGLGAAMDWQCREFTQRTGIPCRFDEQFDGRGLDRNIAINLFRVYQETLTNIARHAEASMVSTCLQAENGSIILSIADNGKGFDRNKVKQKKTLGLLGMEERVLAINGHLDIYSAPGKGTSITIKVNL